MGTGSRQENASNQESRGFVRDETTNCDLGPRESESGRANVVSTSPLRVACIGMGWWSDVLADAIQRSGKLEILSCYTRSEEKRKNFATKYRCRPRTVRYLLRAMPWGHRAG